MKAPIESPLSLEEVAKHFEQWRRGKKKGERIPQQLWSEAIGLVGTYGVSQVTRTLRLSGTDLNRRRGIVATGKRRRRAGEKTAFVEVAPALVDQALGPEAETGWMELERPDGLRLRIRPTGGGEMLALVERFMEV
jgi:hypothetical protein